MSSEALILGFPNLGRPVLREASQAALAAAARALLSLALGRGPGAAVTGVTARHREVAPGCHPAYGRSGKAAWAAWGWAAWGAAVGAAKGGGIAAGVAGAAAVSSAVAWSWAVAWLASQTNRSPSAAVTAGVATEAAPVTAAVPAPTRPLDSATVTTPPAALSGATAASRAM